MHLSQTLGSATHHKVFHMPDILQLTHLLSLKCFTSLHIHFLKTILLLQKPQSHTLGIRMLSFVKGDQKWDTLLLP